MIMKRRTTRCIDISPCNFYTQSAKPTINPMAITNNGSASATAFTNSKSTSSVSPFCDSSTWRMDSLAAALQESQSPICNSPTSDAFYSSRFQSTQSNFDKLSTYSSVEVDECVQNGRNLSGFYQHGLQNQIDNEIVKQNCNSKCCLSMSSAYHSALSAIDPEHHSTSSLVEEANSTNEKNYYPEPECTQNSTDPGSPNSGRHKLITRPKPYNEFLDEVKANQLQAQIDAWNKARHEELMNKLRRKETDIHDWKLRRITKAMKDMEKIEGKMKRKRAQALERTHKIVGSARKEANKEVTKARESTAKKISSLTKDSEKIHSTKNSIWLKLIKSCY